MKKYLFIFGLLGTALFTACSTSDDLISEKPIETPSDDHNSVTTLIAEGSLNSEVPIALGIGQSRGLTRAPLDPSDGNGNFATPEGKYLGVFCLATGTQSGVDVDNIPSAISDNNWNTADDEEGLIVRLKNVPAKVTTDGTSSSVKFWDTTNDLEQHYYYPMGNWMKYNFYAYYPRQNETVTVSGQEKTTLAFMANQVLEKYYEIDGSQDIIWGMSDQENATSVAESKADPYSANYFRKAMAAEGGGDISAYYPKFTFKHKLVQFRFFVKAAKATDAVDDHTIRNNLTNLNAQVTDMYIANAIYKLQLIVASKRSNAAEENGKLSVLGKFDKATDTLRIKTHGADTDRFPGTAVPEDGNADGHPDWLDAVDVENDTPVGYIMLPRPEVSNDDDFKYQLVVKLEYTGGSSLVKINLEPPTNGFEEGNIYNIIVNVQSIEEIFAKAVLQGWQTYKDDSLNPYIVYDTE